MRTKLRAALVTAAAALGLVATSVVPAQAAPTGYDRCPRGTFCVFDGARGQGAMASYSTPQRDFGSWRSKASSVINRTGYEELCLYSRTNFEYLDAVHDWEVSTSGEWGMDLSSYSDKNGHMDNNLGSARWAHTSRECHGGTENLDWSTPRTPGSGPAQPFGDLNRDGAPDLLQRSYAGRLWFLRDGGGLLIGGGWNSMTALTRHGDLTSDGNEDLLARDAAGNLYMYPGNGKGWFGTRLLIGGGWNTMSAIQAAGDLNGDGKGDLLARDTSGQLWMYPGNGRGWFGKRLLIGGGWNVMKAFAGPGDLNGDGKNDLVVSDTSGKLWLYPGNGRGWFGTRVMIGTGGWAGFDSLLGIGDYDGDGHPDLLATGGFACLYRGLAGGRLASGENVLWEVGSDRLL
ncbi:FG-GAP-like repeat-containing protein [Streptomyces sp. NBC_00083]|uniref:FG-GAP-like repeat-containing protein n=1 Tax=Streptomyces sp. NBC_00083 TaxID=2975647 RepID=UPI00225B5F92|nr:FG-GAP-like repeat-containing protein [Streptomyces sp. NBC_00083]MCX5385862.1 FG-GAP-like repeat-containing protein [Streptomyces sp. NBC_00083]